MLYLYTDHSCQIIYFNFSSMWGSCLWCNLELEFKGNIVRYNIPPQSRIICSSWPKNVNFSGKLVHIISDKRSMRKKSFKSQLHQILQWLDQDMWDFDHSKLWSKAQDSKIRIPNYFLVLFSMISHKVFHSYDNI